MHNVEVRILDVFVNILVKTSLTFKYMIRTSIILLYNILSWSLDKYIPVSLFVFADWVIRLNKMYRGG